MIAALLFVLSVAAEELSVKRLTSSEGLANDVTFRIVPDSLGFVWFCTGDGLSRFDGLHFKNYTQSHGLPHRSINDLVELGDGRYLIATGGGLALFDPKGTAVGWDFLNERPDHGNADLPMFTAFSPPRDRAEGDGLAVLSLELTPNGKIYAGTGESLFKVTISGREVTFTRLLLSSATDADENFNDVVTDNAGDVWVASSAAIYRIRSDGATENISNVGGQRVFVERSGEVWIDSGGNDIGIRVFQSGGSSVPLRIHTRRDGLETNTFSNAIVQLGDGRILATSNGRLYSYEPEASPKFRRLDNIGHHGAVERNGTVWFTSEGSGVARYVPGGFSVIDTKSAGAEGRITSFIDSADGKVYFTTYSRHVSSVSPTGDIEIVVPSGLLDRSWVDGFLDVRTAENDWWIPSTRGLRLYRNRTNLKALANVPPERIFGPEEGVPDKNIFAIFRDSRGFIWISSGSGEGYLTRLDPRSGQTTTFSAADGLPERSGAVAFAEDLAGGVWIGFYFGQVLRFADGKFTRLNAERGYFQSGVSDMMRHDDGSIWISTLSRGVFKISEPTIDGSAATGFSTKDGLSTNNTQCLTSDIFGRIYVGTSRGINRLDAATRSVRIFTPADGLEGNNIKECHRDQLGRLWFSQDSRLLWFIPKPDNQKLPSPPFIDSIAVNGNSRPVSELGESDVDLPQLGPDETRLTVSFFATSSPPDDTVRFQWTIDGQEWSPPSGERQVELSLSTGDHRFQVRSVNDSGVTSERPATLRLTINPPVWRRWWFVGLVLMMAGGFVFALDRYRVAKTRQVESALGLLSESELRFRTLADTASDAILTVDDDKNIVFVNRAVGKVFGYEPAALVGRKIDSVVPATSVELDRFFGQGAGERYLEGLELKGLHSDGRELPLELSFGEFERDGRRYFTGIARDVSDKKRAEARLQAARQERINELQRVRSRIATDLHDDIGSSLTQIAVLCEVARGQASRHAVAEVSSPLERIRSVSRELVLVMSDIVWAINPQKDYLGDLVQRMRRFGSDVLPGSGIRFELDAPAAGQKLQIGANIRREVFSIYKESVNNAAKYSAAQNVAVGISGDGDELTLRIVDDGCGFDTTEILSDDFKPALGGNGLRNMRRRCEDLGGTFEIRSAAGSGTSITIKIPLRDSNTDHARPPE